MNRERNTDTLEKPRDEKRPTQPAVARIINGGATKKPKERTISGLPTTQNHDWTRELGEASSEY